MVSSRTHIQRSNYLSIYPHVCFHSNSCTHSMPIEVCSLLLMRSADVETDIGNVKSLWTFTKLLFWRSLIDDDGNNQCRMPMMHTAQKDRIEVSTSISMRSSYLIRVGDVQRVIIMCMKAVLVQRSLITCRFEFERTPSDPSDRASEPKPIARAAQQKIFVIYRFNYLRSASHIIYESFS